MKILFLPREGVGMEVEEEEEEGEEEEVGVVGEKQRG